ncbi:Cell division protein FtsQ [Fundidesulfovibrio magnetotacticus]|uniref:Cell division protein FtsQ n=1 Tax=Fundidesulfovibrio magnetotacticus TaxID=2730080 RepID=A0A6V8LT99_9BACT|nr:FtsQ-type POTRA domain-containing protein [Fundidesulfovibrio magnetotacticus]GFK93548.1 Cell division protein FtsQ [Fundidesulfovibrio magnetotacticus]
MSMPARHVSRLGLGQGKSRNAHSYGGGRDSRAKVTASRTGNRESRLPLAKAKVNRSRATAGEALAGFTALGGLLKRLLTLVLACVALVAVSVGLLAGYRWLTTIDYFAIRELEITGLNRMAREDVLSQAEIAPGTNLLAVNMENVEAQLMGNPWIESAQVTRVLPGALKIRIVEREPSYIVQYEETLCYADVEGRIIDKVKADKFVSLPQVEVESGMERHLGVLEELRRAIADKRTPFGLDQVAWIRLSWRHGMEVRLMDRSVVLCVGVDDWKNNLAHMGLVWENLAKRGELDQAAIISAQNQKVWVEKHGQAS